MEDQRPRGEQVVTCVYCGMAYPAGTPSHGEEALYEHIKVCPKHPLRAAKATIKGLKDIIREMVPRDKLWKAESEIQDLRQERDMLRQALIVIIGSDDPKELEQMKAELQSILGAVDERPDRENILVSLRAIEAIQKSAG